MKWPWLFDKSKHEHDWKLVRTSHFQILTGYEDQLGPWSYLHWRCEECGKTEVTRKRGYWKVEDLT